MCMPGNGPTSASQLASLAIHPGRLLRTQLPSTNTWSVSPLPQQRFAGELFSVLCLSFFCFMHFSRGRHCASRVQVRNNDSGEEPPSGHSLARRVSTPEDRPDAPFASTLCAHGSCVPQQRCTCNFLLFSSAPDRGWEAVRGPGTPQQALQAAN